VGSIVAIEPKTGEILAMVSSPGFDPAIFTDLHRTSERVQLSTSPAKPLFNRAVMAQYPPGSIFKCVNALIGMQEGVVFPTTTHGCARGYTVGRLHVGCHGHPSPLNLVQAVQMSCNAYFCYTFRDIIDKYASPQVGFSVWREHVSSFGFGQKFESDIPNELRGTMPTAQTYDRLHGIGRWRSLSIISLSIGQGELGFTPLHIANLAATIANRGYYFTPHVVKKVQGTPTELRFLTPHTTSINVGHFATVVDGMYLAVNSEYGGTARGSKIPGIDLCGKTGTAQNPHGEDHSAFMCFAPRENPQIAVAVYVENAGAGASMAAPIASLIVEKYLNRTTSRRWVEERILQTDLVNNPIVPKKNKVPTVVAGP
jgi:penicillin-binding protein 2